MGTRSEQPAKEAFALYWEEMSRQSRTAEEILAQYAAGPDELDAGLSGLAESDLDIARAAGKWTIRQIVHHIVDGDLIWSMCMRAALGSPSCTYRLDWYDQEPWTQAMDYAGRAVAPAVALFRANRQHMVQLVQQLPGAWARSATLIWPRPPYERPATVREMMFIPMIHVPWHIEQIRETRQVHGR